jgi:acyl-coenzyme A thioesterase PaaI-like protein
MTLDVPQHFGHTTAGGPHYGELVSEVRRLLDAVCTSDAPDDVVLRAIERLRDVGDDIAAHQCAGPHFPAGHRWELPGRGHPALVPFEVLDLTAETMRGRTRFNLVNMGHSAVAHGGFVAQIFDEAMGVFPMQLDPPARTAWLRVSYRRGVPIATDLDLHARLVEHNGRKVTVRAELQYAGETLAEAEGLFIQPRP